VAGRDITEGDDGVYSSYDGSGVSTVARGVADIGIVSSTSTWQNTDVAYDVAIGGLPFIYAINDSRPYIRQTAPFRKDQFDNGNEPGEQSLTGWWIRSQMSFHSGSGIKFYDPATTDELGHYRFADSKGINVWTKGQATLLKSCTEGHNTTGAIASNGVVQQHLRSIKWSTFTGALMHDGYDVDKVKVTDPSNPVHFIDYNAGAGVYPVYAVCDDGTNAYWMTNVTAAGTKFTVFGKPLTGSSASTADEFKVFDNSQVITNGVMEYVKQRLVICADNKVYECPAAVSSTPILLYTNPSTSHVYTSITASGTAVYISGYNGAQSTIEKYTLASNGAMPVLSSAVIAAELPVGEIAHKIYYYLGYMMIGTNKGIRAAVVSDQDGSIKYGPLIVETTQPCYDFAARDHFVWCATSVAGEPGLIRIDLENDLDELRFAYANDVYYDGVTGHVTTAVCFDGNTDPATTDRLMFCTANNSSTDGAIYVEDATTLRTTGYITTGNIRYGTLEPKNFKRLLGRGDFTYGSMTLETVDKDGIEYDHISYDSSIPPVEVGTSSPASAQEYVAYKFIMYRDGTDSSKGPTFKGYQAKSTIATPRQRVVRFPVYCFDVETDRFNTVIGYEGRAFDRIQLLEDVEETGDVLTWQDLSTGESRQAVIEQVTFTRMTPPDKRFDGFGGVLEITIRTV
jgi:hypothetical protein